MIGVSDMQKPNPLCVRSVNFVAAEERSGDGSTGRTMEGYAAVFNTSTEINSFEGHFSEQIARGAFKKTIAERMPVLQFDHGHDPRTGTTPIGRIEALKEDRNGLHVKAELFDNPVVEPIRQAIASGAISGMSFRFKVTRDQWRDKEGKVVRGDELGDLLWNPGDRGPLQRTIREVQLFEAGPVVFPAYEATTVGVRSVEDMTDSDREAIIAEYARTAVDDDEDVRAMDTTDMPGKGDAGAKTKKKKVLCPTCNQPMPSGTYSAADGDTEEHADNPKKPYGDVPYADPGYQADKKKRYPIDTADHVKAAWSYINQEKNAGKYSPGDLAKVKAKIKAAAKKLGIEISDEKKSIELTAEVREWVDELERTDGCALNESHEERTEEGETPDAAPSEGTLGMSQRRRKIFLMTLER